MGNYRAADVACSPGNERCVSQPLIRELERLWMLHPIDGGTHHIYSDYNRKKPLKMLATGTIVDEILDWKQRRRAIILAHHYQESEIQELADVIGDSLELARKARDFDGDVIAFCGVWFMAETAKVLNPDRIVVVPDRDASCSLVESCPVEPVREFRSASIPDHVDRQLHQHLHRGESGERHPLHVAQRRQDRELDSGRPADPVPAGRQSGQLRKAGRPAART